MTPQEIYERCALEAERQNYTAQRILAKQILADAMIRQAINVFNATQMVHIQALWGAALRCRLEMNDD